MKIDLKNTSSYRIDTIGVKAEIIDSGIEECKVKVTLGEEAPVPSVVIHNTGEAWKLSGVKYMKADITNTGNETVLVEIRLNADVWLNQGKAVIPGATETVKILIPQDELPEYYKKKMIGMRNLPDGVCISDLKTDHINKVSFAIINPGNEVQLLISNIHTEESISFPTEEELENGYFPLLDEFGQYRHADWPLKTHSLKELKDSAEDEAAELGENPRPMGWNEYGGWIDGPRLEATGHFRTEKVDGKWWLVDPEGYLFWSHGMGSVSINDGRAILDDREFYFSELPDPEKYREFYISSGWVAPFGYYKGRTVKSFNYTGWNSYRKYGENWKEKAETMVPKRLKSWGYNTVAAWSSPDIYPKSKIPYTPIIMITPRRIEGSEGGWYKFPDPYDPGFRIDLVNKLGEIEKSLTDPYCIGYFVDNEITWGNPTSVAGWTVTSPADQPAKLEMLAFLKKQYDNINELNTAWDTHFSSWDAFMKSTESCCISTEDAEAFTLQVIRQYFSTVRDTLKELAPNKLYLGPRFDFLFYPTEVNVNGWDFRNNWLVNISAQYCDVVSFNRYRHSAAELRPGDADKPVLLGEWHHLPLERGSFFMGPEHFNETMKMRGEKYEYFAESCLNNKFIIGAHHFQYFDQPTVGREDGENYCCGFLNVCERPYPQMVAASRKIANELYEKRYGSEDTINGI